MKILKPNCYKVLRYERGLYPLRGFYSLFICGRAEIKYHFKKWSYPPKWLAKEGYEILVFDKIKNALMFLMQEDMMVIKGERIRLFSAYGDNLRYIENIPFCDIFELLNGKIIPKVDTEFPQGTMMCSRLKLIEEIPITEELLRKYLGGEL